jgi:iron complex transport system ATP-binding protein
MADQPLVVAGLTVRRGARAVLQDVDFGAPAGAISVLLGPNGAGKSTLLKAVLGFLPHEGEIRLAGQDPRALDAPARARLCSYVPQHSGLEAPLPVRDVVEQGRFAHGRGGALAARTRTDADAVAAAMATTDVTALADRAFSTLSYGERRRVLVARALATGAPVLLLDEPTAALDVGHALALFAALKTVARAGAAVVVVLHQLQEAAAIAQHALLLAGGRCVKAGPAAEVIAPGPVRAVYGVEMVPGAEFACRLPAEPGPGENGP